MQHRHLPRPRRGVSLIEAVVALGVMATGLLGIVGVQSTLRANSDFAKQRVEAMRLAQNKIDSLRGFGELTGTGRSYENVADAVETFTAESLRSNTTYTVTTTVTPLDALAPTVVAALPRAKSVTVRVTWRDRSDQVQSLALSSAVAGITPALAGSLAIPPDGNIPTRRPFNRALGIPRGAIDLGNGSSAFVPPSGPTGVVWVFNNSTGAMSICALLSVDALPGGVRASNIGTCSTVRYRLLAGNIRFSLAGPPSLTEALDPTSSRPPDLATLAVTLAQSAPSVYESTTVTCVTDTSDARTTAFYCAVPTGDPAVTIRWDGRLWIGTASLFAAAPPPASASDAPPAQPYRLCRYFEDGTYFDNGTFSREPPPEGDTRPISWVVQDGSFAKVKVNLLDQNVLVIRSLDACPSFRPPANQLATWPYPPPPSSSP